MATTQIKDGYAGGSDNQLKVNSDGSINVNSTGGGGGNASVGPTGSPVPADATLVGAKDASGNLQPLTIDPSGKLLVDITGTSVVTGTVSADLLGLTSFQTSQYTVGTSAVQLTPTPLTGRSSVTIKIIGTSSSAIVYVGNSNAVTSSTGYPLFNGDSLQMDATGAIALWVIATDPGQNVCVMELGS